MSRSRILSKMIIPMTLLTIYSIALYRTATTPVELTSNGEQAVQTTAQLQSLAVEEDTNNDFPRPPQLPPVSDAISNTPEKFRFVALTDPQMVPASQAAWLLPDDVILGIVHDGEAQAFPLKQMAFHHVINVKVGGEYYLITYCSLCNGVARAFLSTIDNVRYTFNIYGIFEDGLALLDRQTSSVWHQGDGKILSGPLASKELILQPQVLTRASWMDWQELYPETKVLPQYPDYMDQYNQLNLITASSQQQEASIFNLDTRLPEDTIVLGTNVGNLYRAYVVETGENSLDVINDNLNGTPIVIFIDKDNRTGVIFKASVEDKTLRFFIEDNRIMDNTGSRWDSAGHAIQGDYRGSQLVPVASLLTQWSSWSAYHPETSIYGK